MAANDSNVSKGRDSHDSTIGGNLVAFINRNATPYPTSTLGPKFDLVPVTQHKDLMLNAARMYAQQEYDRIMELVSVLQKQAEQIKRRLEVTDAIHAAVYDFKLFNGHEYWLLFDTKIQKTRLSIHGPNDWFTGVPSHYEYICKVKMLGDNTWIEVNE